MISTLFPWLSEFKDFYEIALYKSVHKKIKLTYFLTAMHAKIIRNLVYTHVSVLTTKYHDLIVKVGHKHVFNCKESEKRTSGL